jgi:SAM-dependent methyltransferase
MLYRLAYSLGFRPWENSGPESAFAKTIGTLFDREERERKTPYGSALDLGCGTGIWGVELARRGWQVTGVDIVEKALRRARERAAKAQIEMCLIHGDAVTLDKTPVGSGFRLVLDTGTYHALSGPQRRAMARGVSAAAASDASMLMLVRRGSRGASVKDAARGEIETTFPGWKITDVLPSEFRLPGFLEMLLRPGETWYWYRLRRTSQAAHPGEKASGVRKNSADLVG